MPATETGHPASPSRPCRQAASSGPESWWRTPVRSCGRRNRIDEGAVERARHFLGRAKFEHRISREAVAAPAHHRTIAAGADAFLRPVVAELVAAVLGKPEIDRRRRDRRDRPETG